MQWDLDKQANFQMNEWQLRKTFVNVYVLHEDAKVGEIRLNLYLIATGPYHQDFPIKFTNKTAGRICADVRISQVVDTVVAAQSATVTLIKERPAETFNFTIKAIVISGVTQCNAFKSHESSHSYNERLVLGDAFHKEMESHRTSKHDLVRSTLDEMHKISWEEAKADRQHGTSAPLPRLAMPIAVSDIHNTSLQFLMWQVVSLNKDEVETYVLRAECYISLGKVLQREFTERLVDGVVQECHRVRVSEKIWNRGKLIGEVGLALEVSLPKFLKQMTVYVRSEEGIQKITPFFTPSNEKGQACKEINDILGLQARIERILAEISDLSQARGADFKIKMEKRKVYEALCELLPVLEYSRKESMVMYGYSSEEDLLKGQLTLVDVGFKLAESIEEDDRSLHDICWKCLMAVMKRAELTLRYLGFSPDDKREAAQKSPARMVRKKIELGVKVQTFYYKMLRIVLECLAKKALPENERMFVELFCAYSYFRIPEFRDEVVKVITRADDLPADDNPGPEHPDEALDSLFNWSENFYKPLSSHPLYRSNLLELRTILGCREWIHRMEKRGGAFFFFVLYWARYVEQTLIQSENAKWNNLPSYGEIIRVFLAEMRRRPLVEYPDSMVEASKRLLANERLLNPMVKILFEKTNLYDCVSVIKCVEMLDGYFGYLLANGKHIPTAFNYTYLFTCTRSVLESPHCFAVAKCLLMLYKNYNLLSFDCRRDFTFYLLGKAFFRMFLNWSSNVRTVFHHLLMFRVYLQANMGKSNRDHEFLQKQMLFDEEVRKRYQILMWMIDKAGKLQTERENMKFAYNYERDYSKKMRKKLIDRKKISPHSPERKLHNRHKEVHLESINNIKTDGDKMAAVQRHHSECIPAATVSYPEEFLHPKETYDNMSPPKAKESVAWPIHSPPNPRKLSDMNIEVPKIRRIGPHEELCNVPANAVELPTIELEQLSYLTVSTAEFKAIE